MEKYLLRPVAVIFAVVATLSFITYQPGFFGDELFPYYVGMDSNSLLETFLRINQYKARLLFNGIWSLGVWWEVPRSAFAVLNAAAMSWAGVATLYIARNRLHASVTTSFVAALCAVLSRFGIVFYFDYLSGTIATLGLALFLTTILLIASEIGRAAFRWGRAAMIICLAVATVLTYETYIAGLFALGLCASVIAIIRHHVNRAAPWGTLAVTGVLIWAVPLLCFVLATQWMSTLSVMTGTAGQSVSVNIGTLHTFAQFFSNVFLGTNFGLDWFVGKMSANNAAGQRIGYVCAAMFSTLWGLSLLNAAKRWNTHQSCAALTLFTIALATIAISSLPGLDRADARWMFPLSAICVLLALCIPRSRSRDSLLLAMLAINLVHLITDNASGIYNVRASQTSGVLARAMQAVTPVSERGIVTGIPDNELEWILGGDALQGNDVRVGDVYCWINLGGPPCIDPRSALEIRDRDDYDFALAYTNDGNKGHVFLVPGEILSNTLEPNSNFFHGARTLGGARAGWSQWHWVGGQQPQDTDAVIENSQMHATLTIPADELRGNVIGYMASAIPGQEATMRLQVNWLRADRSLIAPQIEVVRPKEPMATYTMILLPPSDAQFGEIYVTLHDPRSGAVLIHQVALSH
ncbi:hypothetical protein HH110_16515 [Stenotrophomonas sp. SAM-B]|uniref:hypothetical protein n=1 Tax=Stenotrophomonas sp. SAM-B TaxID=2729141 RepID=UPI0015A1828A|nr:hypothetical protein [Stenotrophomonas sp. SAM-B]NWF34646.1 hypothetical protein [Stenotrophomonas sp. SAM-B]